MKHSVKAAPEVPAVSSREIAAEVETCRELTIKVRLSEVPSNRYMTGRIDGDLKRSESIIVRRIQDEIERTGQPVKSGGMAVLRYLLAQIADAEKMAANSNVRTSD